MKRCKWCLSSQKMIDYHDNIWGKEERDSKEIFKRLMLECMQAGLSWAIILNKYEGLCEAFDDFDPNIMSTYNDKKIEELLLNPQIIRHRLKIKAMISNAKAFLEIEKTQSFSEYIWSNVNNKQIINNINQEHFIATSPISDKLSKDLKKKGFKFVGSTTVYAFMQSIGMVNDHSDDCEFK